MDLEKNSDLQAEEFWQKRHLMPELQQQMQQKKLVPILLNYLQMYVAYEVGVMCMVEQFHSEKKWS